MVSFSLRQRIFLPPPIGPSPVSFHLSQFARGPEGGIEMAQEVQIIERKEIYHARIRTETECNSADSVCKAYDTRPDTVRAKA